MSEALPNLKVGAPELSKFPAELAEALLGLLKQAMVEELVECECAEKAGANEKARSADQGQGKPDSANTPLPLAHARRGPGRPRKDMDSHISATSTGEVFGNAGVKGRALAYSAVTPRLLDASQAGRYLGVSYWTVRELEAAGTLRRVCIPGRRGNDVRKLLYDQANLDRLIEMWKDQAGLPS